MIKRSALIASAIMLALGMATPGCASGAQDTAVEAAAASQMMVLDLQKGEVLQFAMFLEKEGEAANAVRKRYFETAIPHAERLGDEYLGNLRVRETLIGENKPRGIAIYAFPDEASQQAFQSSPEWPDYERMRGEGWDELHVFSVTVPQDMKMTFDPEKSYTIAAAWTEPGDLAEYQRYLDGIEADFDEIGARYVAQLNNVSLYSQTDDAGGPSQLTLVEWSGKNPNLRGLQNSKAYKDNAVHFQNAITRFDLYSLSVSSNR